MSILKNAREKLEITQSEAARRLSVSRSHLSRLEQGRALATVDQAAAISELYGVPALQVAHRYGSSQLRRDCGIRPFALDTVNPDPWHTAYKYWAKQLRALDPAVFDWMSYYLPGESTYETYLLLQAAVAGAEPFLGNPHSWDFDLHPVVDRTGRLLGSRVLPGLLYRGQEQDVILFPQVTLRVDVTNAFRLDNLMFYRTGQRRLWLDLEVDASGHDARKDPYRTEKLGMMVVRLTGEEIRKGRAFELILSRVAALIQSQVAPPPPKLVTVGNAPGWRPGPPSTRVFR